MAKKSSKRATNTLLAGKPRRKVAKRNGDRLMSELVSAPSVGGAIYRPRVPRLLGSRNGVMIANTERLAAIATAALGVTASSRVDITPANLNWLNGVALNYSKFRWINVQLYYIPACPTSQFGQMAMGYVYDVNDGTGGNSVALTQQLYHSVSGPVWAGYEGASGLGSDSYAIPAGSMAMTLDCAKLEKRYYKYATLAQLGAMSGPEAGTYIPSSVLIATDSGVEATVGNILMKYEVELIEPVPATLND